MFLKLELIFRNGFTCSYGIDYINFFREILSYERVFLLLEMLYMCLRGTKQLLLVFLL